MVGKATGVRILFAAPAWSPSHAFGGPVVAAGELGLAFVGPEESRVLKREHLGVDEATDALALPIDGLGALPDGMPRQLGDVVVCPEVVGEQWRGPLVHALLHLVGYDHGPEMETREAVYAR